MANSGPIVNFSDDVEPAADDSELNRSESVDGRGVTSSGSLRTNHAGAAMMAPAYERSASENTPLLLRSDSVHVGIISGNYEAEDCEFGRIFCTAEQAIDCGIYPQRISQGSSGSYFVKNSVGVCTFNYFLLIEVIQTVREAATICPAPCKLSFELTF